MAIGIIIFATIILSIDWFVFWVGKKSYAKQWPLRLKITASILYWFISLTLFLTVFCAGIASKHGEHNLSYTFIQLFATIFVLIYGGKLIFLLFSTVAKGLLIAGRIFHKNLFQAHKNMLNIGLLIVFIHVIIALKGILSDRFNFEVTHQVIEIEDLPKSFDGYKILQFSDLHIGSFIGHEKELKKAFGLIEKQDANLFVFTGDMVNFKASEAIHFKDEITELAHKTNLVSVLGNHDYEEREQNISFQEGCGIRLLLNQSIKLYQGGDSILLIGVENWGLPPFPAVADLAKATPTNCTNMVKILLSHDPSRWEKEVATKYNIGLTLSGHTHGMQYGIRIGKRNYSPAALKYPQWKGIYKIGKQALFVSTGIGNIAFPGRVGMPPEICIIELKQSE